MIGQTSPAIGFEPSSDGNNKPIIITAARFTGKTPFVFSGTRWIPDPTYTGQCAAGVLKRSAVPVLADAAGLIPGESTAKVVARLGGAAVSGVISAWRGDAQGAGLGYAGINSELFGPAGAGQGKQIAQYVPVVGSFVSAYSLGRDIVKTTGEFLDCGS